MDYRNPDYSAIFAERGERLTKLRNDSKLMAAAKIHYRYHPWDFVNDWGMTFDPRNLKKGLIASMPFVLWPKQVEYLQWLYGMWKAGERGLVEKSRDCGVTWLSVGFAVSMWCFEDGFVTGFGSRKEELVDKAGDDKSIFEKLRFYLDSTPVDFLPDGFDRKKHVAHMKVHSPTTGAAIIGEAGDNIGRGGRTSIYIVDESAFVEHQDAVDAALSQNTDCQIDISTPNGNGNAFYRKRQRLNNTGKLFIFDWRDDPRKDAAWYAKQVDDLDEVIVAQEIDRDYNASAEDAFIPAKWVAASIDAHTRLGFEPMGIRVTGFDPADTGDAKATVNRHGSVITEAEQLKKGDITQAIPWAFMIADGFRADVFSYDGDGMGAPSMKLALQHRAVGRMKIDVYKGSDEVFEPEKPYGSADHLDKELKTNAEMFKNYRSQTWTWARDRFKATYDAVERAKKGLIVNADPETLISISSKCKHLYELQAELSRPMRIFTPNGYILVESKVAMKKRGVESPNLADAAVIAISVRKPEKNQQPPIKFRTHKIRDRGMGY